MTAGQVKYLTKHKLNTLLYAFNIQKREMFELSLYLIILGWISIRILHTVGLFIITYLCKIISFLLYCFNYFIPYDSPLKGIINISIQVLSCEPFQCYGIIILNLYSTVNYTVY